MNELIEFKEPFLDFYTRCNSKTYYHKMLAAKLDVPVLVHSHDYRSRLISECRHEYGSVVAPIFCIHNDEDYYRYLKGSKYRRKKFIVDDVIVFRRCHLPDEIEVYQPEEVRDMVLAYLANSP